MDRELVEEPDVDVLHWILPQAVEGMMETPLASRYRAQVVALRVARYSVLFGVLSVLAACNKPKSEQATGTPASLESVSLEINGYNYTDLYIDSFEVNGQGGGNVFVSTPTSGGGGSVCCVSWWPGSKLPVPLKIKWTRDRNRWCEKEVLLTGPVPANPRHLGVHFFPDGRIEAELTEDFPEVKLKLESVSDVERKKSGNTVPDEQTARCQNGYPY